MNNNAQNLKCLSKALQVLREALGAEVNISRLLVLLTVQRERGIEQFKLGETLDFPVSTLSRIIIDLSGINRRREPGPDLIRSYQDPMWRRRNLLELTPRGEALMAKVAKALAEGKNEEIELFD